MGKLLTFGRSQDAGGAAAPDPGAKVWKEKRMSLDACRDYANTRKSSRDPSDVILQINRPGQAMLQFPAVIRNLTGEVVSLQVVNPWTLVQWDSLHGLEGRLRLLTNGTGELINFPGKVAMVRYFPGRDKGVLNLGLALDQLTPAAWRVLNEHIPNRPRDIQLLWERWEQAQKPPSEGAAVPTRLGFAGLTIIFCGLIMQTHAAGTPHLLSLMYWLIGTLGILGQTMLLWKGIRTSSIKASS